MYPNLRKTLLNRGATYGDVAAALDICPKSAANKLAGRNEFSWHQALTLYTYLFPGDRAAPSIDWLFERS